jgi:hypothetical protein
LFNFVNSDMELNDLTAFISVARAGGFRDAARTSGVSASSLSIACAASKRSSVCAC